MSSTLRLALRNLLRQRTRTALSLFAIALGVAGLIVAGGFVEDVFVQLAEATIHSRLGHMQIAREGFFSRGASRPSEYMIESPGPVIEKIRALPQVQEVLTRVSFSGLLNNGRSDLAILGEGVEPDKENRLGSYLMMVSGRPLKDSDRFGMLIGEGVAEALHLHPGDPATLLASTSAGAVNTLDFTVVGVFRSFSKDFDARAVRIQVSEAQELLDIRGVNVIVVGLRETRDTEDAAKAVAAVAGPSLEVRTWRELSDFYEKTRALYERQFRFLELIILCMIALSVLNSVNMTVTERIGEFGTIRALGRKSRDVRRLVGVECALLGAIGSLLGVVLGVALAALLSGIGIPMPPPPNADVGYIARIRIVPAVIALAYATGALSTLLASIPSARRAAKMPIVDALRQNT